jgi:hypothetical protein
VDTSKASSNADDGWKIAQPDYVWSFPRDHWATGSKKWVRSLILRFDVEWCKNTVWRDR